MTVEQMGAPARFKGLSTDTKPTNVAAESTFLETDTNDKYEFDGISDWYQIEENGAIHTEPRGLAGEKDVNGPNEHFLSSHGCSYTIVTADTDISVSVAARIYAVTVIAATATDIIEIRDSNAAGSGTVLLTIPAGTAINTRFEFDGEALTTGLFADFTGTGSLRIAWRKK